MEQSLYNDVVRVLEKYDLGYECSVVERLISEWCLQQGGTP